MAGATNGAFDSPTRNADTGAGVGDLGDGAADHRFGAAGSFDSPANRAAASAAAQNNPFGRFASPDRPARAGPNMGAAFGTPEGRAAAAAAAASPPGSYGRVGSNPPPGAESPREYRRRRTQLGPERAPYPEAGFSPGTGTPMGPPPGFGSMPAGGPTGGGLPNPLHGDRMMQ